MEAIERIERYARRGETAFEELIQAWVVRHFEVLGEALRAVSPDLRKSYPELPWSDVIGMRNILIHDYFDIDVDIVWTAAARDLGRLKTVVARMLADIDSD
jgi:uncharacterized protein with HEPN domain